MKCQCWQRGLGIHISVGTTDPHPVFATAINFRCGCKGVSRCDTIHAIASSNSPKHFYSLLVAVGIRAILEHRVLLALVGIVAVSQGLPLIYRYYGQVRREVCNYS